MIILYEIKCLNYIDLSLYYYGLQKVFLALLGFYGFWTIAFIPNCSIRI